MLDEKTTRDRLDALLRKEVSLSEFSGWLTDASWDMHKDSPQAAQDIVDDIDIALAEYDRGYLTHDELLEGFRSLLASEVVVVTIAVTDHGLVPAVPVGALSTSQRPWWSPDPLVVGFGAASA